MRRGGDHNNHPLTAALSIVGTKVVLRLHINKPRNIRKVKGHRAHRRLGPSGRRFYRKEILKQHPHPKDNTNTYSRNPLEVAKEEAHKRQEEEERHRRDIRGKILRTIAADQRQLPAPRPSYLPNGIPSVRYDPPQVDRAYFRLYHHPRFHPLARQPPVNVCEQGDSNSDIEEGEVFEVDYVPLRGVPDCTSTC